MLKPFQLQPRAENSNFYALHDFLEMRGGLTEKKRNALLKQAGRHLDLSGEIQSLPAFMVGAQAVLCIKEEAPETYWVYNSKKECLSPWIHFSQIPEMVSRENKD